MTDADGTTTARFSPRALSPEKRMGVVLRNQLNGPASQRGSPDRRLETSSFLFTLDRTGFIGGDKYALLKTRPTSR